MFQTLTEKITQVLRDNSLTSIVYNYEARELKGDPAVVVVPSSNEADYDTNNENIRIYAFNIRLYVRRSGVRKPEDAERIMRELVSSVIDDFDKDYTFSGLTVPTGYTYINTFTAPSAWGYSGDEDQYRVSEINLQCRCSVDLNNI